MRPKCSYERERVEVLNDSRSTVSSLTLRHVLSMNVALRLLFVLASTLPALAATPPAESRKIESEILRLENERVEALLKGDVKSLERLYADEMIYVHSAGRIDTKPAYLASLAAGSLTYVTLRYDPPVRVAVVGPDTAIASGRATIEIKNKAGQVTKRVLTTLTVYVRSGTTWRVVSYQGTPVQS